MKGNLVRPLLLSACLLLAPLPALADTPNFKYDFLEVGHLSVSPQNGGSGSGGYADFAYSFIDSVQFLAGYSRPDYGSNFSAKDYQLGIAGEDGIVDGTDVYTDILYVNHRNTVGNTISTDDGYRLEVGLRHRTPWSRLELDGYLAHNYLAASSNEVGVGLLVDATSWLALGVAYSHDSQYTNTTSPRLRLYF